MKCVFCNQGIEENKSMVPLDEAGTPNRRWICLDCKKEHKIHIDIPDDVRAISAIFDPAFLDA